MRKILFILTLPILLFACKSSAPTAGPSSKINRPSQVELKGNWQITNVSYPATILPILQTYCLTCHSTANAPRAGGGFRLATYPDFLGFAKSGLLMNAINNIGVPNGMPKGGNKLSV